LEKVGSGVEVENVELMKRGVEDGWLYGVKVRQRVATSSPTLLSLFRSMYQLCLWPTQFLSVKDEDCATLPDSLGAVLVASRERTADKF